MLGKDVSLQLHRGQAHNLLQSLSVTMSNINNLHTNDELPAFVRREDDTELHATAVWNAPRSVRTYITMDDPTDPADFEEARDVAEVCTMLGLPIHGRVFRMLGRKIPNVRRRRIYSTQPMSESKRNCRNYGHARDRACNATGTRHALMCHGTHALDAYLASQHGIPAAGIVPRTPDHEDLEQEILSLRQQLATAPGQTGGTSNPSTIQQVTDLQQQLVAANNQVAALTVERDDLRRQLGVSSDNLTTANARAARVTIERDTANAEAARLRVVQNAIRTNLGDQLAHLIQASPTIQAGGLDSGAVAREVANHLDMDRLVNDAVNTPRADRDVGGNGGVIGM